MVQRYINNKECTRAVSRKDEATGLDNVEFDFQKIISRKSAALKKEISLLEDRLDYLRTELESIQRECDHSFHETHVMRQCTKCGFAESLYY